MQSSEMIHPDKNQAVGAAIEALQLGAVLHYEIDEKGCHFHCEHGTAVLQFVTNEVLRLRISRSVSVTMETTPAVILHAGACPPVQVFEDSEVISVTSGAWQIDLRRAQLEVTIARAGETFCHLEEVVYDARGTMTTRVRSTPQHHFYGLGEKTGFLDKRGERYEMWNSDVYAPHVPEIEALYASIPFLLQFTPEQTCGLYLDNPGRTIFDMRSRQDSFTLETTTGDIDLYVLPGSSLKAVIGSYAQLTGTMPMPPKWALGYHQSRYSYTTQAEVLTLARTFQSKKIPCEAIYLDIHYMDEYRVFTFDKVRFPNPAAMVRELADMGIHLVPIVDPGVKRDGRYPVYLSGVAGHHFCESIEGNVYTGVVWPGESAFPDFTDDKAVAWWGDNHKFYTDLGIQGIWNDMNEPAVFNDTKTMDVNVMHKNNGNLVTHGEVHNLYGLLMSKATFEGLQRQLQGGRPFVLTRAGYAGVQRYAAIWTGDNRSFWDHMLLAMPMVMNLGLSGVAFAGPDVGGFAHHSSAELLARWTQMGAFFPFFRNHSAIDMVRQEPWSFGEEIEEICRRYIQLRYQLMPYLYTQFYEASQTGVPVMRPLLLEYPEDTSTTNLSDEFLCGRDLLVAPVYQPDARHRMVYLPTGRWYDYWTGVSYEGGRHIVAAAPLDTLPLFVRAGAMLMQGPVHQYANDKGDKSDKMLTEPQGLELHVYARAASRSTVVTDVGRWYDDDGETYAYERGIYSLLEFLWQEEAERAQLVITAVCRDADDLGSLSVRIKHLGYQPRDVQGATWRWDDTAMELILSVTVPLQGESLTVMIIA